MTIAQKIIEKCGGIANVAAITGYSETWVYRWTAETDKGGTGGRIPQKAQHALIEAARQGKCNITPADFFEGAA